MSVSNLDPDSDSDVDSWGEAEPDYDVFAPTLPGGGVLLAPCDLVPLFSLEVYRPILSPPPPAPDDIGLRKAAVTCNQGDRAMSAYHNLPIEHCRRCRQHVSATGRSATASTIASPLLLHCLISQPIPPSPNSRPAHMATTIAGNRALAAAAVQIGVCSS